MRQYLNEDWLRKMYIDNKLSQKYIAKLCDVDQSTIHKYLKRFSIPCRKFCCPEGHGGPNWKGGKYISSQGYKYLLCKDHPRTINQRYVKEEILIVEAIIGRFLHKDEVVHHIDSIRTNNIPENLFLFPTKKEHDDYHHYRRWNKIDPITKSNLL